MLYDLSLATSIENVRLELVDAGWLAIRGEGVYIIALASTTNLRGNKQVRSPFSNLHRIKGNEKSMSAH